MAGELLRIAHGHGNRRPAIARAIAAGVDLIEADLRYDGGRLWVRHEHRVPMLPLLFNRRLAPTHRQGRPWSTNLGQYFFRLDVQRFPFEELLQRVNGRAGLLLDLKRGRYSTAASRTFVRRTLNILRDRGFAAAVAFCGSWRLLDVVGEQDEGPVRYYSVDSERDWLRILPRLESGEVKAVSLHRSLANMERAAVVERCGARFLCWGVADAAEARTAVDLGASGIISADLDLLRELAGIRTRFPAAG